MAPMFGHVLDLGDDFDQFIIDLQKIALVGLKKYTDMSDLNQIKNALLEILKRKCL